MRSLGRWVLRLAAVPVAAAIACAAAPAAGRPAARIPNAITVNGVWIGGLTTENARARLRDTFSQPLTFRDGRREWTESRARFGVAAAIDDAIAESLGADPGSDLSLRVEADRASIAWYVRRLDRLHSREPRDARLLGLTPRLTPSFSRAVPGRRLDRRRTAEAIERAIAAPDTRVVLAFTRVAPKVTAKNFGPVVVIRRSSNVLHLYDGRRAVRQLGVATGTAQYPTPLGTFAIVDMQYNPWWYPPPSDWARGLEPVPPGPGNPLGTRWMGLNVYGVGMHGTPDAASIGYSASHGCIRLQIADAEWLFERVRIGTPVVIVAA